MFKRETIFASLCVAAILISGCGDGGDSTDSNKTSQVNKIDQIHNKLVGNWNQVSEDNQTNINSCIVDTEDNSSSSNYLKITDDTIDLENKRYANLDCNETNVTFNMIKKYSYIITRAEDNNKSETIGLGKVTLTGFALKKGTLHKLPEIGKEFGLAFKFDNNDTLFIEDGNVSEIYDIDVNDINFSNKEYFKRDK